MKHRLTDIERTLLSAYMDGELTTSETHEAEALLSRSQDARLYLSELRAVEHLSTNIMTGSAVAGGTGFTAKLTGSAIQAAAKKSLVIKAASMGSWGIVGTVGVVATAVVGLSLSLNSPKEYTGVAAKGAPAPAVRKSDRPAVPAAAIEAGDVVVPPMTTSDLVAFAADGTLPLDAGRHRFLTLATGRDTLALCVHSDAPPRINPNTLALRATSAGVLDSLERVIRTSVIHSDRGIALRADIPALRLDVIRSLEEGLRTIPAAMRSRLERSRAELAAYAEAVREVPTFEMNAPVEYHIVSEASIMALFESEGPLAEPFQILVDGNGEPAFVLQPGVVRMLSERLPKAPPPMLAPTAAAPVVRAPLPRMISNPAGERPEHPRHFPMVRRSFEEEEQVDSAAGVELRSNSVNVQAESNEETNILQRSDTVRVMINRSLDRARQSLRAADSVLQKLRMEIRRRIEIGNGNVIIEDIHGEGESKSEPENE